MVRTRVPRTRPDSTRFESFNGYFHCCFTKQFCNLVGSDGASRMFAKPSFYSLVIKCLQRFEKCPIEWLCFVGGMRRQWKHDHILTTSYLFGLHVYLVFLWDLWPSKTSSTFLSALGFTHLMKSCIHWTGHNTSRWGTVTKILRSPFSFKQLSWVEHTVSQRHSRNRPPLLWCLSLHVTVSQSVGFFVCFFVCLFFAFFLQPFDIFFAQWKYLIIEYPFSCKFIVINQFFKQSEVVAHSSLIKTACSGYWCGFWLSHTQVWVPF